MKIGVFDSGIGGKAVARRLQELIPDAEILFVNDPTHVPYGTREPEEIISLTDTAIQPLLAGHCDAIVLACNTATTIAITELRKRYPSTNFVGIEPMVKPAASQSKTKHIAVLATPATLRSARYAKLKEEWAAGVVVEEPDCHDWAAMIEAGRGDEVPIEETVQQLVGDGVDTIVLACTHYHWLVDRAQKAADGKATILEPSDAIGRRVLDLLGAGASPLQ
jgi:glutamate racemase